MMERYVDHQGQSWKFYRGRWRKAVEFEMLPRRFYVWLRFKDDDTYHEFMETHTRGFGIEEHDCLIDTEYVDAKISFQFEEDWAKFNMSSDTDAWELISRDKRRDER